ncbi:hypothetical protein [Arthrobacter alpinus]|uniref:hypothetical protein n=1 Tax=Arthrobacter alpinus TaxID=656366 RepID=UPI000A5D5DF0|nr:hypothetical protein [Arthrobacter alpinus]
MTFSSRPFWHATARRAVVAAMVSALCLAVSAVLAASAHGAEGSRAALRSATVISLSAAPMQVRATEKDPVGAPTVETAPPAGTPLPPATTATVPAAPEQKPAPAPPEKRVAQPEPAVATPERTTETPTVSEAPWPTYTPTETPQTFVPASQASQETAAVTEAELSLTNETSGGVNLMTWMMLLLGVTVLAGLGVGIYALLHVRGRHHS